MPCTEKTDLGHLANIVYVYNSLPGDVRFSFNKNYFMGNLENFLDRMAKSILDNRGAIYMDLCHRELNPSDDNLASYVSDNDRVDPRDPQDKLWTIECLIGWCLHDAFVTYLHSIDSNAQNNFDRHIAFESYVLKNEWHNATRDDNIRTMRHTVDKYNELLSRENSRFYLESGEIYS